MANLICVQFMTIYEEEVFFEVENPDYEADTYKKGKCITKMIQNGHNQFLVLDRDCDQMQLCFQDITMEQFINANCKFKIQLLRSSYQEPMEGQPVVLQVDYEGKTWTLCCSDDGGVNAKTEDLPDQICSKKHRAVFFLRQIEGQLYRYRFESSLLDNMFLSFEREAPKGLVKLVLKMKNDEDDTQKFQMQKDFWHK